MPVIPPSLVQPGDKVIVVAPAGPVEQTTLDLGLAWLAERYQFISAKDNLSPDGYLAGTDARRQKEFQAAIDNGEAKAIIAARGGYGTTRILDHLNLTGLAKAPKWIVGSSDLTAVLITLFAQHGMLSIHGPMVFRFGTSHKHDLNTLVSILEGSPWAPPSNLGTLCNGVAEGPLIGGNLTILAHMAGTISPDFTHGAILFLEDVGEQPYRLDRCLTQLKRAGMLEKVSGVILGEFAHCNPGPDGVTVEEVMIRNLGPLNIPVATGYPAAHGDRNYPFIHGAKVVLDADDGKAILALDGADL
jgi:muramoyltetrapeptide carboxypeptidase